MTFEVGKCLLHKRLREARMTQQELADKIGMKRQQVSDYANNRKVMSAKTMKVISHAIGCSMEDLYEWIPTRQPKSARQEQASE